MALAILGGAEPGPLRAERGEADRDHEDDSDDSSAPTHGAADVIRNEVRFAYGPLWELLDVHQNVLGAVTFGTGSTTETVSYAYDAAPAASGLDLGRYRLESIKYPNGSDLVLTYGAAESINDLIGRADGMQMIDQLGTDSLLTNLVAYDFLGLDRFAAVEYPHMAGIALDRTVDAAGRRNYGAHTSQTQGVYPGWDRFGRLVRQDWVDPDFHTNGATPDPIADRAGLVQLLYSYERPFGSGVSDTLSNIYSKTDARRGGLGDRLNTIADILNDPQVSDPVVAAEALQ